MKKDLSFKAGIPCPHNELHTKLIYIGKERGFARCPLIVWSHVHVSGFFLLPLTKAAVTECQLEVVNFHESNRYTASPVAYLTNLELLNHQRAFVLVQHHTTSAVLEG